MGMNSNNYCVIFGWMMNEMKLSGNELLTYAVIYGFSQDGESRYKGGRSWLASTLNVSKPTIDKALRSLREKGYIHRTAVIVNGVEFGEYHADLEVVKNLDHQQRNFTTPSKETLLGSQETLLPPSKETLPSNNNTRNIREYYKGSKEENVLDEVPTIKNDAELRQTFLDFIEMRKKMKKPMTEKAVKLLIDRCFKLTNGDPARMAQILDRSIAKGWMDVYPYEDDTRAKTYAREPESGNPFTAMKRAEGMT